MAESNGGSLRAWDQFLLGKRALMEGYRRAKQHAKARPVQTHHGVVGEAEFRTWIESFLPKRYGVTSGYIRPQRLRTPHDFAHFDVIIYDQLDSPILWIEENPDKSESGKARIIPAEHVRAVLEIKATLSGKSMKEACEKLGQLEPLMAEVDEPGERYPTYLRQDFVAAIVFFELLSKDANDAGMLSRMLALASWKRTFYGAMVLSGEGLHEDHSTRIRCFEANEETEALGRNLLGAVYMSASSSSAPYVGTMSLWNETVFSDFAFDLLALLNGTYQSGLVSSFHGVDMAKLRESEIE